MDYNFHTEALDIVVDVAWIAVRRKDLNDLTLVFVALS